MTIRVLIADDQALVRSGLSAIIRSQPGIEVAGEAEDGVAAIEAARRLHPDVILMDIRMPRLDGVAATRALLTGTGEPRILILTTFSLDAYVVDALRAGASGYLLKDAPASHLIEAIKTVAAGEAMLAPAVTRRLLERFCQASPAATGSPSPGDDSQALRAALSQREADVLLLVAHGHTNAQIATTLEVAESTVKTHVKNLLTKLGLHNRVQLAIAAYDAGLVQPRSYPPTPSGR